ncbi:MAG: endopeptidase La [candidate division WOR-3 bacterium]|nr:endopeptidase La [Candidatus Omnitrophota bacterium]MCM8807322.1 endopeptidase La [Candidatus Omnitrophota bacterium]
MALLKKSETKIKKKNAPALPLRDLIIFPHMVVPLFVGRTKSLNAIEEAISNDGNLIIVFQRDPNIEDPKYEDIYSIGVFSKIIQSLKETTGVMKILVEVTDRVKIIDFTTYKNYFAVNFEFIKEEYEMNTEIEAMVRLLLDLLQKYLSLNLSVPKELYATISTMENPYRICDAIAGYLPLKLKDKGKVLETISLRERISILIDILNKEVEILEIQKKIQDKVVKKIEDTQRQYILTEQLKQIQRELGKEEETPEIAELREKIKKANMPKNVEEKALEELNRLSKMMPLSPEATVSRTYIEWLCSLPWSISTEDNLDINHAKKILDEDHYGLEKVKERILEYLAVRSRTDSLRGPILCFVGPPGVGKTSLGKSIARALGRKFVRVSLGGVRDEAEIRGHRRTYIGSLPGRIIQSIRKAGVNNPVFLLDEIDKLGKDFRGDPASALLEVLDPEQNKNFSDHYLEVEFDLSKVLFITTANTEFTIPPPLLDRMEVIHLPGYTVWEKKEIAKNFLIPKQMKEHGLTENNIKFSDEAIFKIIKNYTREAGVRNLEREIANICRKVTKKIVETKKEGPYLITVKNLEKYLGPEKYSSIEIEKENKIGVATGMAWTEYGGEIIFTEVLIMKGKGDLILTGQLGDVMKESARAALSYVRAHSEEFGISPDFYKEVDIHIHVPEGAIPKDGPSAGVTIITALVSSLTKRPVDANLAMTGEITLQGKVLKIGGLKAKILAAQRAGIKKVIIPKENDKDLVEIPKKIKESLEIIEVEDVKEVLEHALLNRREYEKT